MLNERDGRLYVAGAMTMHQAAALLALGEERCTQGDCIIDLAEVESADSSAIAVVLGWVRRAHTTGRKVQVLNPPQSFVSLAALYGVDQLLAPYVEAVMSEGEAPIE
ncbi:STAS domain-containing protein [Uliginosibacterium gangwonense]|uniref:STAS domain-containing protein n=1 Tax=Uliginosibacterium gangwonense TaxID=392736 RepID=UPI000376849F|nr:STAS domain-containing protein [Uliginosibacterium gangwonense]